MKRGQVIIVDFPFSDGSVVKRRPALVVHSDALTKVSQVTIAATITTKTTPSPTSVFIDPGENPGSALRFACAVECGNLHTLDQSLIYGTIGHLSPQTMKAADDEKGQCLPQDGTGPLAPSDRPPPPK